MFFFNFKQDELEDYYLVYFDILGYKSYFENESDPYDFLSVIQSAIEDMKKSVNITHSLNDVDVRFRAYSDNFLFYIKHENNELGAMAALSFLTQQIQRRLLEKYSILIRGGITIGKFYVNKDFIFGKGLIDVYTLENKFAVYPRNSIYLYDDHFVITYNYKGQSKTVTFEELNSSPLTSKGSPNGSEKVKPFSLPFCDGDGFEPAARSAGCSCAQRFAAKLQAPGGVTTKRERQKASPFSW